MPRTLGKYYRRDLLLLLLLLLACSALLCSALLRSASLSIYSNRHADLSKRKHNSDQSLIVLPCLRLQTQCWTLSLVCKTRGVRGAGSPCRPFRIPLRVVWEAGCGQGMFEKVCRLNNNTGSLKATKASHVMRLLSPIPSEDAHTSAQKANTIFRQTRANHAFPSPLPPHLTPSTRIFPSTPPRCHSALRVPHGNLQGARPELPGFHLVSVRFQPRLAVPSGARRNTRSPSRFGQRNRRGGRSRSRCWQRPRPIRRTAGQQRR